MKRAFYAAMFGALGGVALGTLFPMPILFGASCMLGSLLLVASGALMRRAFLRDAGILSIAFAVGLMRISSVPTVISPAFEPLMGTMTEVSGTIVAMPDVRETSDRLTVELRIGNDTTRIIAAAPPHAPLHVGDRVRVYGQLSYPLPFDGDGGHVFAYDKYLAKDGIFAVVQPARVQVMGREHTLALDLLRFLEASKNAFGTAIGTAIPEPESALALGIIVGGKQGLGKQLLDAFTASGMLQIVVLSGYNVMIVAEGTLAALAFLPRRIGFGIASAVITIFVLLAGAGSSAVRAGIMALIALFGRATHRTYDVLRALFIALVTMVLWNPLLLIYDPGLQLSFMATLGLILGAVPVATKLTWIRNVTVRGEVATNIAAQTAVLPLILYQSGNLSFVSIPANLAAMPVIPFAMAASAVAGAASFLLMPIAPVLAASAGLPAFLPLTYVIHIATFSAALPFANIIIPAFPFWFVAIAYAMLGYAAWKLRERPA
jgi:competence protein ComEC